MLASYVKRMMIKGKTMRAATATQQAMRRW